MKRILIGGVVTLCLSACEVPVMLAASANDAQLSGIATITFPAKMLMVINGQEETLYSGSMMGHMNGAADIEMASADGRSCVGRFNPDGAGQMSCDGWTAQISAVEGADQTLSGGIYYPVITPEVSYEVAMGWGKGANEAVVRHVLAQKRSLTPNEVRDLAPS